MKEKIINMSLETLINNIRNRIKEKSSETSNNIKKLLIIYR